MPRKKKEVVYPGYVRVRYPDMQVLGALTQKAVGKNRSITEFAEACGLAPSTISRIIKAKFTNPVSDGIIAAIAKNADPESGVTLEDLLAVHGLVPVTLVDEGFYTELDESKPYVKPKIDQSTRYEHSLGTFKIARTVAFDTEKIAAAIEKAFKASQGDLYAKSCQEIIQNALINAGYAVQLHKDMDIVDLQQFQYLTPFAFSTNAVAVDGLQKWAFDLHDGTRYSLVQKLSWIFGAAYLDSPSGHGIKITLITADEEEFELAKQKFSDICIPDCVSVILVDMVRNRVMGEFQIRQTNAEAHPSVFDTNA